MAIWSYGVTCVPERFETTLPGTMASLAEAGWDCPRLFIDGPWEGELPEYLRGLECTARAPRIGAYGSWLLALLELYIRQCRADFYAIFQDDLEIARGAKEYIERSQLPADGYLNLMTFAENMAQARGWYAANQKGLGAVALVFPNAVCQMILQQSHMIEHIGGGRGTVSVDGAVVTAARRQRLLEYVHNPGLVQHTGYPSIIVKYDSQHREWPQSPAYAGRDAGAEALLAVGRPARADQPTLCAERPAPRAVRYEPRGARIGLVGYNTRSGLGALNRALADWVDIDRWLMLPHRVFENLPPHPQVDTVVCRTNEGSGKVADFVRSVDVVVFGEQPLYTDLIQLCRQHNVRTVCVPMQEWMPPACSGWAEQVDLFLCPTRHAYEQFAHQVPCLEFPWPVDTQQFPFEQRTACHRFVFLHGHGGWKGRKGGEILRAALRRWPEMPLVVADQTRENWPAGVERVGELEDPAALYALGDVLLVPHCVDGLALEPLEAAARGMPVISTAGRPWDEYPAIGRIRARVTRRAVRRPVDWYEPDPEHLVDLCRQWLGDSIERESQDARRWAEGRSWERAGPLLTSLLRGELSPDDFSRAWAGIQPAQGVEV